MSVETMEEALNLSNPYSSSNPLVLRLRETLTSCSKSTESGDPHQSKQSISELVDFLDSISDSIASDPQTNVLMNDALEVLSEIYRYISSSSLDQVVIDALSFELPKAVTKFAGVSDKCLGIVDNIIDWCISSCSPRDMLSILCEALDSSGQMLKVPSYFSPLLSGISKVLLSIQRRQFEQAKVAVPIILNVLMSVSSESDDEDMESENMFERAISIADSIQTVCEKLEGRFNKKLGGLLGLYVLQIMALVSISMRNNVSSSLPLVLQLSRFLQYCGLSYCGLITGSDIKKITSVFREDCTDDEDDYMSNFSYVKHGACVAVIWGHISSEVALAAGEDLSVVKDELRNNQAKRWQAVGMLKHLFSAVNLPWELKKQGIDFLVCIMPNISQNIEDEHLDFSSYVPGLFAALQAVVLVIMYAPDAFIRRNAFEAMKRVLADIPASPRFDIIKAMITNSGASSLTAILVDRIKDELQMENCQQLENKASQSKTFWSPDVLELVEFVLRPPKGGPPSLPEAGDAVLSVLNLYRFLLIKESTGKTNFTGVLSKVNLRKAYNEWLQPLRTLVTGIMATNHGDYDQLAVDAVCALNPVELVLYRCIELVEEKLKHST